MKKNKAIISFIIFIVSFIMLCNKSYAKGIVENMIINTEDTSIDEVRYNNYYLRVNKIIPESNGKAAYCLEIDKEYPSGESFRINTDKEYDVTSVLQVGYPNLTPAELGVSSEEEAYFATQIALWCYLEGYDANFITGENINEVAAIKKIYNEAKAKVTNVMKYDIAVFFTNEEVQDIAVLFEKESSADSTTEDNQIYNGK